uniref:Uncharacterized protein n=1 Tax=Utricularia reniformis TaxID=192314 RepID=A0A1Y0AZ92_9LAMI|nr:hypothetical protein AEK19_MT0217 [Utricularia reniformis]ART30495.1 hypothetical protein AEK19_MT0217 [Utricularia reniformis]
MCLLVTLGVGFRFIKDQIHNYLEDEEVANQLLYYIEWISLLHKIIPDYRNGSSNPFVFGPRPRQPTQLSIC